MAKVNVRVLPGAAERRRGEQINTQRAVFSDEAVL